MTISVNGSGIEYSVDGPETGMPVILIHGFPFSKEMWKPQTDVLKKEFHVISYDVRGHGASDVGNGQYTIELCVDDLLGLLETLTIPKVVVVGLSMGGYIALRAIERNPERFRGLVLCDTRSEGDTNEAKIKRAVEAKHVTIVGTKKFADLFLPTVFMEKNFNRSIDAVNMLRGIIEKTSPIAIAGMLIALAARTDTTPSLAAINIPTLLMVGEFDELTPPSSVRGMKEKIAGAEMHTIPEASHVSNLENPDEFNRHLLNFLRKIKE